MIALFVCQQAAQEDHFEITFYSYSRVTIFVGLSFQLDSETKFVISL